MEVLLLNISKASRFSCDQEYSLLLCISRMEELMRASEGVYYLLNYFLRTLNEK